MRSRETTDTIRYKWDSATSRDLSNQWRLMRFRDFRLNRSRLIETNGLKDYWRLTKHFETHETQEDYWDSWVSYIFWRCTYYCYYSQYGVISCVLQARNRIKCCYINYLQLSWVPMSLLRSHESRRSHESLVVSLSFMSPICLSVSLESPNESL